MDVARHRGGPTSKALERGRGKKKKYQDNFWAMRRDFAPFLYTVDGIAGRDARAAEKRLYTLLAEKW